MATAKKPTAKKGSSREQNRSRHKGSSNEEGRTCQGGGSSGKQNRSRHKGSSSEEGRPCQEGCSSGKESRSRHKGSSSEEGRTCQEGCSSGKESRSRQKSSSSEANCNCNCSSKEGCLCQKGPEGACPRRFSSSADYFESSGCLAFPYGQQTLSFLYCVRLNPVHCTGFFLPAFFQPHACQKS